MEGTWVLGEEVETMLLGVWVGAQEKYGPLQGSKQGSCLWDEGPRSGVGVEGP